MANDTRKKLIEVATQLFATKGFGLISIRDVTDAAGINVSAISYYFSGKEGLYQAVLEEQLSPIRQVIEAANARQQLPPVERLTFYAHQIALVNAARPYLARFICSEIAMPTGHGGTVIEGYLSQSYQFLCTSLADGVAAGDFRPDLDINYAAVSLAGILNFYFLTKPLMQKFVQLPTDANTTYAEQAFAIYLRGILQ